jgi:drug/metabolite transporter (DMT)-like permease
VTPSSARLIVVGTSVLGGSAYLVVQRVLQEMGPLTLSSVRFLLGGVLLLSIVRWLKTPFTWGLLASAAIPGITLGIAMTCMVTGLKSSLSTVAAFLVCSDAFFIPVIDRLLFGRKTSMLTIACLAVGAIGLSLITLHDGLRVATSDLWLLAAAVFWAAYCSTLGHVVRHYHALSMSCAAHLIAGTVVGVVCYFVEAPPSSLSSGALLGVLYFAVIISALRFTLKTRAQQVLLPAEMGLMFLIEPISAAALGVFFAHESLKTVQWVGALLVLVAVALPSLIRIRRGRLVGVDSVV